MPAARVTAVGTARGAAAWPPHGQVPRCRPSRSPPCPSARDPAWVVLRARKSPEWAQVYTLEPHAGPRSLKVWCEPGGRSTAEGEPCEERARGPFDGRGR